MLHLKSFLTTAIMASLLWACGSDTTQKETTAKPSTTIPAPEYSLYAVRVDQLRLRDAPGQGSNALVSLDEGTIVAGTGKISDLQDEIELRGVTYRAPYIEVRGTEKDADVVSGWVYGGGLTCLYRGTEAKSPDADKIGAFAKFLRDMNVKELYSGGKAWAYVEQNFTEASRPEADAVYILLHQFLFRMQAEGEYYKLTENKYFKEADIKAILDDKFQADKHRATAPLAANGFRITTGEGMIFPIVDLRRFQEYFGPRVTQPMQKYLNQRTSEQNTPMMSDGGILIPLELVAELAVFWETFNRDNPYFQLADETQASERWLQLTLLGGTDNTPVFDSETQEVDKDFQAAWTYLQNKYPQTTIGKLAKQMAELCAAGGWKRTPEVDALLKQYVEND